MVTTVRNFPAYVSVNLHITYNYTSKKKPSKYHIMYIKKENTLHHLPTHQTNFLKKSQQHQPCCEARLVVLMVN